MANYNSPYALYTPANPAETFGRGFDRGLGIRRNLEETAKLIREREEQEQSQALMKQVSAQQKELNDRLVQKREKLFNLLNKQESGQNVDHTEVALTQKELFELTSQSFQVKQNMADQLLQSGLPTAMGWGRDIADSMVKEMNAIGQQTVQFEKLDQDAKEASKQRQLERDLSADRIGVQQDEIASRERMQSQEISSREGMQSQELASREGMQSQELASREKLGGAEIASREKIAKDDRDAAMARIREQVKLEIKSRQQDPLYKLKLEQATIEGVSQGVPVDYMNQIRGELGLAPLKEGAKSSILDPEIKAKIDNLTKAAETETDPDLKKQIQNEIDALKVDYKKQMAVDLESSRERRQNADWWKEKLRIARAAARQMTGGIIRSGSPLGGVLPGVPTFNPVGFGQELHDQLEQPFYDYTKGQIDTKSKPPQP